MGKVAPQPGKWLGPLPEDATVLDAARTALVSRIDRVAGLLPLAAHDADADPEHVHQLRVMSRRSDAVLTTFADVFPARRRKKLKRWLRRLRKAADPARDLDVLLARLQRREDTPANFLAKVRRQRRKAQPELVVVDRQARGGRRLRKQCRRLLDKTPASSGSARRIAACQFAEWAPRRAEAETRRLLSVIPADGDTDAWHRFRVVAKRLRYSIELLASALPTKVRTDAYPLLVDVQQKLGRLNDHATAVRRISSWRKGDFSDFAQQLVDEEVAQLHAERLAWQEGLDEGLIQRLTETLLEPLDARVA